MRVLSDRERLILHLRFREDRLQSQIAEITGVSQMLERPFKLGLKSICRHCRAYNVETLIGGGMKKC